MELLPRVGLYGAVAAYELFVTLGIVVVWEVIRCVLSYPFQFAVVPVTYFYAYFGIALVVSLSFDCAQIYCSHYVNPEVKALNVTAVRTACNYVIYATVMTCMATSFGFKTIHYTETDLESLLATLSSVQKSLAYFFFDSTLISIGRFFTTLSETLFQAWLEYFNYSFFTWGKD